MNGVSRLGALYSRVCFLTWVFSVTAVISLNAQTAISKTVVLSPQSREIAKSPGVESSLGSMEPITRSSDPSDKIHSVLRQSYGRGLPQSAALEIKAVEGHLGVLREILRSQDLRPEWSNALIALGHLGEPSDSALLKEMIEESRTQLWNPTVQIPSRIRTIESALTALGLLCRRLSGDSSATEFRLSTADYLARGLRTSHWSDSFDRLRWSKSMGLCYVSADVMAMSATREAEAQLTKVLAHARTESDRGRRYEIKRSEDLNLMTVESDLKLLVAKIESSLSENRQNQQLVAP